MPTPEQLARFYDDDKRATSTPPAQPARPAPAPSAQARTPATPQARTGQLSPAERRARFFDDMKPSGRPENPDTDREALRRRSDAVEAQRSARRAKLYDDMPSPMPGAEAPVAAKPSATEKPAEAGDGKAAVAALELDVPAGIDRQSPVFGQFRQLAGELGLNKDGAGKMLALYTAEQERTRDASMDTWEAATRADREIGGDRLEGSIADAREALDRHGTPELRELLDQTGLGSHVEVIRLLARVARTTRSRGW